MASSNTALLDELSRTKDRTKSIRERAARKMEQATELGAAVVGGGVGGFIDGKWAGQKWLGVGYNLAISVVAMGVGLTDLAGRASGPLAFLGAGQMGWEAGKFLFDKTKTGKTAGSLVGAASPHQLGAEREQIAIDEMRRRLAQLA